MRLSDSAHLDSFCRDRLPPPDQWPEFRFDLPELNYPERLNCAAELLDATAARDGADRPCPHSAGLTGATETRSPREPDRPANRPAPARTGGFGPRPATPRLLRAPD